MQPSGFLYVVTLTLNGLEHTKAFVSSIAALGNEQVPVRLVVIDNGSTDGTREWLRQVKSDGLVYVANEQNIGVSAGWNMGLRIAMSNGAQAVLVCGNDTVPMPGTVQRLIRLLQDGCPFVTGTAVPYDTPMQPVGPIEPDMKLLAAPDFSFFMVPTRTISTLAMHEGKTGARISPWLLGLFDEGFTPAYGEDNDMAHRLHRAGLLAVRDPGALFRHDCSLTIRTNPAIAQQNQQTFKRNMEFFREKWGGLPHELDCPPNARPLNCTDEQWQVMTGGRVVETLDPAVIKDQAKAVYRQYGIES